MARVNDRIAWEAVEQRTHGGEQCVPVPAGEVDAADRPREEQVAGKEMPVGVERNVAGAVAWDVDDVEGDPGDDDLVAAADDVLRIVRENAHPAARLTVPQGVDFTTRRPDADTGAFGKSRDAADVIDIGVRDEDRGRPRTHACELEPQRRRIVARVDDRRVRCAPLGADDVAVRLERSHHEAVDDQRHEERLSVGVYASAVQRWDLHSPNAPNGTRDPIVLHSDDGARAVLIVLRPGQELGEHQVKENAWLTVIEGEVEVACGGHTAGGGPGTFMRFDPGERHTVRSEKGARVLLLLAPWPAAGHYSPDEG